MANSFYVYGPFPIGIKKEAMGRVIEKEHKALFWDENPDYASWRGCYVFGVRAGKGITPWYVGKATKRFDRECFHSDKLYRYMAALARYRAGTPIMYFIVADRFHEKHVHEVETFLIRLCHKKNPDLMQTQKIKYDPPWEIHNVTNTVQGAKTAGTHEFRGMIGIDS